MYWPSWTTSSKPIEEHPIMKNIALTILLIGIITTLLGGYNYMSQENTVEVGSLEITKKKSPFTRWSPMAGISLVVVGVGLLYYSAKKST